MEHVYINHLKEHIGREVVVKGWLYNKRSSGKIHFLLIRDGKGIVQCIATKENVGDEMMKVCDKIMQESSVVVKGTVREDKRAPGGVEIDLKAIELIHQPPEDFPIALKSHGIDFLMGHRHLWLRSRKQVAALNVRAEIIRIIREFFDSRGFVNVDAPILTPSACEGTTNLFELEYFDEGKAYLSQSGQLYMEAAAMALGKVYCFGPTFRAERSKTRKHLTEFWMVEPEVAFANLDDIMNLAEEFVYTIVSETLKRKSEELKILERDITPLEKIKRPFVRISYDEAIKIIKESGEEINWGDDFGAPHETALSSKFDNPVLVYKYPAKCKAFYMKRDPENPELALCVDVIAPEGTGEIIGGGQREDDFSKLEARIKEHKLPLEAFKWYLDLRKFGSVPHSGFGLGLERTVAWLCGLEHIREAIPFPRMLYRIYP